MQCNQFRVSWVSLNSQPPLLKSLRQSTIMKIDDFQVSVRPRLELHSTQWLLKLGMGYILLQTEGRVLNESRNFLQATLSTEFVALLPLILFQKTFYDTDAVYAHPSYRSTVRASAPMRVSQESRLFPLNVDF